MATVGLDRVTKVYRAQGSDVVAVDEVSLSIADREFAVLVGPSGCGKSTTLRMVAGLEEATSGTIRIGDRVVNHVAPKDRDVAMVFQNYALYPHMTVYKNMAFGLRMRKVPKGEIRRRVGETAGLLGIEHLLDRKPKQLSGGERQRVAVGRAIVREPQAFLFDEPLSNLDAKLRVQMRAELKRLHRRLQTTVIYVTHDQEEAMTLGDRIVVMKAGMVHQCGTPQEVYDRPLNRFVASFVGTPPMGFLEGLVRVRDQAVCVETGSGTIRLPGHLADRLSGRGGDSVVVGIRPEALSFWGTRGLPQNCVACGRELQGRFCHHCGHRHEAESGRVDDNRLRMRVTVIEPLGDEKDVHLQTEDGVQLVARVPSHLALAEGTDADVYPDVNRLHVFDLGEAGLNIGLNGYRARSSVN